MTFAPVPLPLMGGIFISFRSSSSWLSGSAAMSAPRTLGEHGGKRFKSPSNRCKRASLDYAALRGYPLYPYLRYRDLSRRLTEFPTVEVRDFLQTYSDTPLANRLRNAWLRQLASARRWDDYLRDAVPGRDPTFECWRRQALLNAGQNEAALRDFATLWRRGSSLPSACDPVIAVWQAEAIPRPNSVGNASRWR